MLTLYNYLTKAAYVLLYPWLKRKYATGFDERRGIFAEQKRLNNAIWIHAVSVGEVQAALPFISEAKKHSGMNVLLSTTTMTGAKIANQLSANFDAHIFFPWDTKHFIARALDCLKPRAFVTVETEIWPIMLSQLKERGIPSFLINGRISDKSFKRMSRFPSFWKPVFSCFDHIMVREKQDEHRLEKLGVSRNIISVTGDCKIDALLERKNQCDAIQAIEHSKPIFVAGSTHPGEEEQVIAAFVILRGKIPGAKLIIVPRHPERANEVGALTSKIGRTVYYSEFVEFEFMKDESAWEFLIVDKIGALFCLYSIAEGAFIGGSLVPKGGQNIMEPALFGTPFCHGKYMSDFSHVSDQFKQLGISKVIATAEEIADFWMQSADEKFKHKAGRLCENWFIENSGGAAKNWNIISKYISR